MNWVHAPQCTGTNKTLMLLQILWWYHTLACHQAGFVRATCGVGTRPEVEMAVVQVWWSSCGGAQGMGIVSEEGSRRGRRLQQL